MVISRKNIAERAAKAAASTPSLDDRLRHAQALAASHPVDEELAAPAAGPQSVLSQIPMAGERARFAVVPLELIDTNPFNARKIYRPERVAELAASIGAHGQEIPGIATHRDGRYILAAGHYRLRAIKVANLKHMNLMVYDGLSDRELYEYSYRENAEREGQSPLDNALAWKDLLAQSVYGSETELAEATGMSLPNVNKTLRILTLSDPVLDVVKESPAKFALSALYELALFEGIAGVLAAIEMARRISDGEIGRKEIQEARAALENPKPRKAKETSRQYRIKREGINAGTVKVWDSGRLALDVVFQDHAERDAVLAELKARFGVTG